MLRFLLAPLQTKTTHRVLQLCGVLSNVRHKVRSLQRTHFVRSCGPSRKVCRVTHGRNQHEAGSKRHVPRGRLFTYT
jgi:hypothetical protein